MEKVHPVNLIEERPGVEQRLAKGKSLRNSFPIAKQGDYKPAPDRADPVSILEEQGKSRLADLVPIRYARMLSSPFAFLRGAAAVMAADLAAGAPTSGIPVQACGDMHVANFGIFASAERNLIFGINDFDETLQGPWEWDLKRLVASIVASGRFLGANEKLCEKSVRAAAASYRNHMKEFAHMGNMELWYTTITEKDILKTLSPDARKRFKKLTTRARERTHLQVLGKMTDLVGDKHRLRVNALSSFGKRIIPRGCPSDKPCKKCSILILIPLGMTGNTCYVIIISPMWREK
jgi:hypothetical protein